MKKCSICEQANFYGVSDFLLSVVIFSFFSFFFFLFFVLSFVTSQWSLYVFSRSALYRFTRKKFTGFRCVAFFCFCCFLLVQIRYKYLGYVLNTEFDCFQNRWLNYLSSALPFDNNHLYNIKPHIKHFTLKFTHIFLCIIVYKKKIMILMKCCELPWVIKIV